MHTISGLLQRTRAFPLALSRTRVRQRRLDTVGTLEMVLHWLTEQALVTLWRCLMSMWRVVTMSLQLQLLITPVSLQSVLLLQFWVGPYLHFCSTRGYLSLLRSRSSGCRATLPRNKLSGECCVTSLRIECCVTSHRVECCVTSHGIDAKETKGCLGKREVDNLFLGFSCSVRKGLITSSDI